jgi:hypothetical protein
LNKKIRQSFVISDMVVSLRKMRELLEVGELHKLEEENIISTSIKMCFILMTSYPKEMFLEEEAEFVSNFTSWLKNFSFMRKNEEFGSDFYG